MAYRSPVMESVPLPESVLGTPLPRVFRPQRSTPADTVRPTRAEVSQANLRFNLKALRRRTSAQIWCVLKADAYGHGAKACARTLERAGADGVCVALVEEGIELRSAGIQIPVLVMGGYYRNAYSELLAHALTPVLCDASQVAHFAEEARYRGLSNVPAHIKVDTGMGRLGVRAAELPELARYLGQADCLRFDGLMTHLASAQDKRAVDEQLERFKWAEGFLAGQELRPRLRHAANTEALLRHPHAHFEMVRPGIGIFGVEPSPGVAGELRPAMRVVSTVIGLRKLQPGEAIGYGSTWLAQRPSLIATIPIGYADGLSRSASNRGHVLLAGRRVPIVGAVSMDMITVDVTEQADVALGDLVVIMGPQWHGEVGDCIPAWELAEQQGTIAWEALTQVSRRVPRFYREFASEQAG